MHPKQRPTERYNYGGNADTLTLARNNMVTPYYSHARRRLIWETTGTLRLVTINSGNRRHSLPGNHALNIGLRNRGTCE